MRWCALSFGGGDFRTCGCAAPVVFVRCRHGWVVGHPFGCALVAGFHMGPRAMLSQSFLRLAGKVDAGLAAIQLEATWS